VGEIGERPSELVLDPLFRVAQLAAELCIAELGQVRMRDGVRADLWPRAASSHSSPRSSSRARPTAPGGSPGAAASAIASAYVIDVNPRIYGAIGLAIAAGQNLPAIWTDLLLGRTPLVRPD